MSQWVELVDYFEHNSNYNRKGSPEESLEAQAKCMTLKDKKGEDGNEDNEAWGRCLIDKAQWNNVTQRGEIEDHEDPDNLPPHEVAGCEVHGYEP
jgi:hypothetical protein